MTNFTKWRSIIDGSGDIPDSDLTQYSETDSQNLITVDSSSQFTISDWEPNDESRLYDSIELSSYTYSFDVEFSVLNDTSVAHAGFGTVEDAYLDRNDFLDLYFFGVEFGIDGIYTYTLSYGSTTVYSSIEMGTKYTIELSVDTSNNEFTVTVKDSTGTELGTATDAYNTENSYNTHYAVIGNANAASSQGDISLDATISSVKFS